MMLRKAQTATEYLIILAVVIVIALIVVGVLGGIPSIGGGAKSNAGDAYWQTAPIAVDSIRVGPDNATLVFRNNEPNTITINGFTLTHSSNGSAYHNTSTLTLNAGRTGTLIFYSLGNTAGNSYSYTVNTTYSDAATSATLTFDGSGNKLEGTVAQS